MKKYFISAICQLIFCNLFAQADVYSGTWEMKSNPGIDEADFKIELKIAEGEQAILYPALLHIQYKNFDAQYQLLLVKKQDGRLSISRNKFAVAETPFSIGTWTIFLNGTLDLHTAPSTTTLKVSRLVSKKYGVPLPAILSYPENYRTAVLRISRFLKEGNISLQKINTEPWRSADVSRILHSYDTPAYFGLIDTLYTQQPSAVLGFSENNISDNDSISITLNGKKIIEAEDINQNTASQKISLDTGLNILCFFAENYGRVPPNTARLNLQFKEGNYALDFTKKENISATFIVAKIYYYPDGRKNNLQQNAAGRIITEKIKNRVTKQIDSITALNSEITLAIWDDAVEDGDSISLQINNDIFLPGIAVKKKPLFIPVKLLAGENKIFFIADNLGSIPPNTSILEIIDGKRRKAYMINTNLGVNNSIKIIYNHETGH